MGDTLVEVPLWRVGLAYLLLILPISLSLWLRAGLIAPMLLSVLRMTLQLLFVGLYLQVIFKLNELWLTALWMLVMVTAADLSVVRSCGLRLRRFLGPLMLSLMIGAVPPLLYFLGPVLGLPRLIEARYAIPLFGMVLGNCMSASIVALRSLFRQIHSQERLWLQSLALGATLSEALWPFWREAFISAMSPTIERIATIGLVNLPGMMTGVVLTGASPFTAVKYQTVIMLSILCGTSVAIVACMFAATRAAFTPFGTLDKTALAPARS